MVLIVENFLHARGLWSPVQVDGATKYWSYVVSAERLMGFISFHVDCGECVLSASITIGLIGLRANALLLLEQNMAFENGLAIASEAESMVVVRFSESAKTLTPTRFLFLLTQLHVAAEEMRRKFVVCERILLPLPGVWFEIGGDS